MDGIAGRWLRKFPRGHECPPGPGLAYNRACWRARAGVIP
jgi:hypothetical protein